LLFFVLLFQDNSYEGTITYVIDGDSFILKTETESIKVILDGIDCPEKDQPFGTEAKSFLNNYCNKACKVLSKSVDKYGRTIGVLWVDSVNIKP
jgi:micrococcal nuclease